MRILKKLALVAVMLTVGLSAFAIESGLYTGSASAVHDDSYYYMNLIDWQKLDFDKFYGFTNFNGVDNSLNLAGASHLKNGDVLAYSYEGNLWADNNYNFFSGFWGHDKLAVKGSLGFEEDGASEIILGAGYNVTDKISFSASVIDLWEKDKETIGTYVIENLDNIFALQILGKYNIKNTDKILLRLTLGYAGIFLKNKVTTTIGENDPTTETTKASENIIHIGGTFQYKFNDRFTFGSEITFPEFTFYDEATVISFEMRNGFIAGVVPNRLYVSAGLETTLPSLTFEDDEDVLKGNLINSFYLGAAFDLTPQVRITSSTNIAITDGLSLEEAWQEVFSFALQMKF